MSIPGAPDGGPQVWYGDSSGILIATSNGLGGEGSGSSRFRIYTPDSRLRVKVSVIFVRSNGSDPANKVFGNGGAQLYLGEEEIDRSGMVGSEVLSTDILRDAAGNVIHQAAPLPIPEDIGLEGFTIEFVTAADSILGILTISSNVGPAGAWILQVRFQPDGQRLCADDWDWIKRKCHATLLGGPSST
jgi:hypothetical protein